MKQSRFRVVRWLLLAVVGFCFGCNPGMAASAPLPPRIPTAVKLDVLPTGIHQQTIQRPDGSPWRYTISVPDEYSDDRPAPLVVALHYGGEVTPYYGRGILEQLVVPALAELNAIIIAPDSIAGRVDKRNE